MSAEAIRIIQMPTRQDWRNWLQEYHRSESQIWLLFPKRRTGLPSINYNDAVEEALCFGWIDSLIKRLDDVSYVRKFTPRTPDSRWSTANRRRYEDLKVRGLLTAAGLERPPTSRSGDAPRPSLSVIPPDIKERLKTVPSAWNYFQQLAPSYQRTYIGWIDSAKRKETKEKRLREAVALLAAGRKLGLK
jgi:uncharacterized protein YdeI (YjbR/CyaY-like superfamily)